MCPVFCARVEGSVAAAPDEVMDLVWVRWEEIRSAATLAWAISPWAREQVPLLEVAGLPAWAA